ncbi:GA-binding protein subunit beta-1-like [Branchiostoma floridae]|uniref:GA-binding protein subunit beta-1-like n=1 Tax=Branchiostoma floridae TaxID=7739 RepID=A0A9J7HRP3_BRAFL|nr:GA-binding protein subunit beta-1-like [Branchiostoma floridae]
MAETYCDANEFLLHAAENGSVAGIEMALKAGADIDYDHVDSEVSSTGTALFLASNRGHVDVVRLLLRKGASMVKRAKSAFAPLHTAAHMGNTEVMEVLVQHGATLEIKDGFQNTPLMTACIYNHVDTVKRLIELGARPYVPDDYMGEMWGDFSSESLQLVEEARKTKLLRCCNPKCGKPGYRSALKLCGRCKLTRYCSRDCQIQHWTVGHKKCCGHDAYTNEGPTPFFKFFKSMADDLIAQARARAK